MAQYIKSQAIAGVNPTVTGTATSLYTLIDTAESVTTSKSYYNKLGANAVIIVPEDGDIRYGLDVTPTATAGFLLKQGVSYYLSGIQLANLLLIRASGNVKLSIQIIKDL